VLRLLASTLSQREIGGMLFISFNTVETHTRSIFQNWAWQPALTPLLGPANCT
jgi:DNA-binding NarL/FixJ family response regulator